MATREYQFVVGPETSTLPTVGTPTNSTDLVTKGYVDAITLPDISNLGLSVSLAGNAMTIALKQADGSSNPASDSGAVSIAFRSSTAASGSKVVRNVTSALSVTISSGSTVGSSSGVAGYVYVYAIDNSGTVELAVSGSNHFDEGSLQSTTAEGGAGAADSGNILYSTTARTSKAIRLIGRVLSTQATAGTWVTSPTEVSVIPFESIKIKENVASKTTTYTATIFETLISCDASGGAFTVNLPAASLVTGKHYYIKKTDSSFNIITIDPNGSETIDGSTTTTLNTQYEAIKIVSNGSNWIITERYIRSIMTFYAGTHLAAVSVNPNLGSTGTSSAYWQRIGNSVRIVGHARWGGTGTSFGTGDYLWTLPTGISTVGAIPAASNFNPILGTVKAHDDSGSAISIGHVFSGANENFVRLYQNTTTGPAYTATSPWTFAGNDTISVDFTVPIDGWKG